MASHFQAQLIKTAELDPAGNYIFGIHPHGILCLSGWLAFSTNGTGFDDKYPGIKLHALTLRLNLKTPVIREYIMHHGLADASRGTCLRILQRWVAHHILQQPPLPCLFGQDTEPCNVIA